MVSLPVNAISLATLTLGLAIPAQAVQTPQAQIPALRTPMISQSNDLAQATGVVLLQTSGSLESGDSILNDGSLYDVHPFEGEAGQTVTIQLESSEFDTYLILTDADGQALAENDDALLQSPYDVLADWHEEHDGNLRIILPDTYGTKGFLDRAPDWLAGWTGIRVDSGDPATGAEIAINWWKSRGEDPREKLVIFSDGLDANKIIELQSQFAGRCRVSFGWGTMLTNDFKGLVADDGLAPFSLVCKAVAANGKPTVKLSDNPNKAMGPEEEIARYKRVFGVGEQVEMDVVV